MIKRVRKCIAFKLLKNSRKNSRELLQESKILREQALEKRLKAESLNNLIKNPNLSNEKELLLMLSNYKQEALSNAAENEKKAQKIMQKALRKKRIGAKISRIISGKKKPAIIKHF